MSHACGSDEHPVFLDPSWHANDKDKNHVAQIRKYENSMKLVNDFRDDMDLAQTKCAIVMDLASNHSARKRDIAREVMAFCDYVRDLVEGGDDLAREINRKEFVIQKLHQEIYTHLDTIQKYKAAAVADKLNVQDMSTTVASDRITIAMMEGEIQRLKDENKRLANEIVMLDGFLGNGPDSHAYD